jgi:steroid delta-isomerase-like uncharacterized protein
LTSIVKRSLIISSKSRRGKMKKLLFVVSLVILLCFTISCQNKSEKTELEKFKAQAEVEAKNKALANSIWEAWNKGDYEAWKQMHAPEYVWYSPSNSAKPLSREETIEMAKMFHTSFPDAITGVEELIAAGDRVISRWIFRGTHKGEFAGIPATGKKIESSGIMITRIENGKSVEDKEDWDMQGFMQQLGMELKPKEIKK